MNIGQNAARLERPNATRQPLTARITRCGPILAIRTEERRHLGRATRRPSRRFCFSVAKRPSGRPPLRRSSRTSSGSSDDPASGSCIHDERKSEPGDFSLTWLLLRNGRGHLGGFDVRFCKVAPAATGSPLLLRLVSDSEQKPERRWETSAGVPLVRETRSQLTARSDACLSRKARAGALGARRIRPWQSTSPRCPALTVSEC